MTEFTYYKRNEETGEMIEVSECAIVTESKYYKNLQANRDNWVSQKSASDRLATNRRTQLCAIEELVCKEIAWNPEYTETSALKFVKQLISEKNID